MISHTESLLWNHHSIWRRDSEKWSLWISPDLSCCSSHLSFSSQEMQRWWGEILRDLGEIWRYDCSLHRSPLESRLHGGRCREMISPLEWVILRWSPLPICPFRVEERCREIWRYSYLCISPISPPNPSPLEIISLWWCQDDPVYDLIQRCSPSGSDHMERIISPLKTPCKSTREEMGEIPEWAEMWRDDLWRSSHLNISLDGEMISPLWRASLHPSLQARTLAPSPQGEIYCQNQNFFKNIP